VVQWGINSAPKFRGYKEKFFKDEPSLFHLGPGTLAFAKAGPDTNSTQVFVNLADNSRLTAQKFTVFAKITKGFQIFQECKQVGDPNMGLDQGRLYADTPGYLAGLSEKPVMILQAEVGKP
jgi:cyclophilin family peptidyl-prolyl cis-trans isomerase